MADKQFVIKGTVVDKATGDGVEDLYVEAWNEHGAYDKTLGALTYIAGISLSKCWSTLKNVLRSWKVSNQAMLTSILNS